MAWVAAGGHQEAGVPEAGVPAAAAEVHPAAAWEAVEERLQLRQAAEVAVAAERPREAAVAA